MVCSVVDGVDTDSIDAQLLELGDVPLAASRVGNGIGRVGGTTRLIIDTTDVKSIISGEEG